MPLLSTTSTVNQRLLFGTAVATPVAESTGFSINMPTDWAEDSSSGDSLKTYKANMSDFQAEITKWYDHNETVLRNAALLRTVGKAYWYPDFSVITDYMFWTGQVSFGAITGSGLNAIIQQTYQLRATTQPDWRP